MEDLIKPWIVVYATDDNYAMPTGVSITSLCENNAHPMVIYVISDGISGENRKNLSGIADKYGKQLKILEELDLSNLAQYDMKSSGWITSSYMRLFLDCVVTEKCDRVLWIDSDTCIVGDISYLFTVDMSDYEGMAVIDAKSTFKRMHGFKYDEKYFNAGIMLFNLKTWESNGTHDRMIAEIVRRKGKSIDNDQSYINCVLFEKIGVLSPKYNYMTTFDVAIDDYENYLKIARYSAEETYSKEEIESAKADVRIIHYTGQDYSRPWTKEGTFATDIWNSYFVMTPWSGEEKREYQKTTAKKWKIWLSHFVLSVEPLRILYIYKKYGIKVKK